MKRRSEENLIQYAFGELSEKEMASIEGELRHDPASLQTTAEYSRLRADLHLLKAIPEPQIGVERIRDAILGQGLKPHRNAWSWSWLLAPALGAVVLAGFLVNRNASIPRVAAAKQSKAAPGQMAAVGTPNIDLAVLTPSTELTDLDAAVRRNYFFGKTNQGLYVPPATVHYPAAGSRRLRAGRPSFASPSEADQSRELALNQVQNDASGSQGPSSNAPTATAEPSGQASALPVDTVSSDRKVVVIDETPDRQTGAERATEVTTSSDVLVGG